MLMAQSSSRLSDPVDVTEAIGNAVPAGILDVFSVSMVMAAVIGTVFKLAWSRRRKITG
jgi:hypothetical protein